MASHIQRRKFLAALGGAAAAWPLAARAQQPTKLPTVGYLGGAGPAADGQRVASFVQQLRELGWIEGRNVTIEYRWAEGRPEQMAEIAAEFLRLKVDVIFTWATPPAIAAKQATSVIPIVLAVVGDPVGTGLVVSLARPGGNVTGLSIQETEIASKRVELLREVMPDVRHLAFIGNLGNPGIMLQLREVQAATRTLGLEITTPEIRRAEDIAPAFEALKGHAEALYVASDPLLLANRVRFNTLVLTARLPAIYNSREWVEA